MRILLVNGGAKSTGATQEILLTIQQAVAGDAAVDLLCLGQMGIHYCRGCKICYETCRCVQRDDMDEVIRRMEAADVLVIAAPSYWADVPGQLKVFFDRCTAYANTNPNPRHPRLSPGKRCFAVALRTGMNPTECRQIVASVVHWCGHMEVDFVDSMIFCGIGEPADLAPYKAKITAKAKEWIAEA